MQDYSAQNEPNEDVLFEMMDQAEKLAGMLNGRRWAGQVPRADTWPPPQLRNPLGWYPDTNPPDPGPGWITPQTATIPIKPPITDAIQREAAYSEAKRTQQEGGGAGLASKDRDTIEGHIKTLERIANDIELMRTGSEIIDSAVWTLRMASLGLVKASSPVQGAY